MSVVGSMVALAAIVAVLVAVLPKHVLNVVTPPFHPTFRLEDQRILMTQQPILTIQIVDWLLPLRIIVLLIVGPAVFRKMITHEVLVLSFTDGSTKVIEGVEGSEEENEREVVERALEVQERPYTMV